MLIVISPYGKANHTVRVACTNVGDLQDGVLGQESADQGGMSVTF